jgi:hypothetical protein
MQRLEWRNASRHVFTCHGHPRVSSRQRSPLPHSCPVPVGSGTPRCSSNICELSVYTSNTCSPAMTFLGASSPGNQDLEFRGVLEGR